MFGDFIGQTSTVVGNGSDLTLGDPVGSGVTWRSRFADGEVVFYLDTTRNAQKRELGYGVLTHGTPDKIARNVLFSTQANARINWANDDVHTAYSVPVGVAMSYMLKGGLGDELPAWAPDGSLRWSYDDDSIETLWKHRLKTADGEIELGRHDVNKGAYFPSPRRPWTATGTAGKVVDAEDIGGVFTFNNSAAARTMTLPAHGADGIGHGFRVGGLGLTKGGQYGIVLTPAAGDGIEGGADAATLTVPGGLRFDVVWDQPSDTWRIEHFGAAPTVWNGRRQTVAAGPGSSAGVPTFLPSTNGALSLTEQNVSATARMVLAAANGWDWQGRPNDRVCVSQSNQQWTSLAPNRPADTPNYLYKALNADGVLTPSSTILPPIYQHGGTPDTTNGQFTFNWSEMKGYLGNGTTAPEAFVVFVGEAATDGSGVISTVAYTYNGIYESTWTATLPGTATATNRNHNLGVPPRKKDVIFECTTADVNYVEGQQISIDTLIGSQGGNSRPIGLLATRNAMTMFTTTSTAYIAMEPSSPFTSNNLTLASWKYKFLADRGWG